MPADAAIDPSPAAAELAPAEALSGTSKFVPIPPQRVLDTRIGLGAAGELPPGATVTLAMPGRGGVPATGAAAVLLNVTVAEAAGPGYVQVLPTGRAAVGASSNLNVDHAGATIANLVVAPLGDAGQISVYSQGGGHIIADVFGYFDAATSSVDGRYVPVFPSRLLDTRMQVPGKLNVGGSVRVPIIGRGGVPATGASAVVVNVTATDATDTGYLQVLPTGQAVFGAFSNLNLRRGQTLPNLAVVPLGADGSITVFSERGAHVIVDVFGYFTNTTATLSSDGLFVPISPTRLLDTRTGALPAAGSITPVTPAGRGGIPSSGVTAVFGNITATGPAGAGYVQVAPGPAASAPIGFWSNVNVEQPGQTVPNAAIANLGDDATIVIYTSTASHLLVDAAGYFTGAAVIANNIPSLLPIRVGVAAGQSVDINVLDYAFDLDGETLTVTSFTQPGDGTVSQTDASTIRYTSYVGPDRYVSFTVTVSDRRGARATTTVTVHVTAEPAPPPCSIDYGGSGAYPAEAASLTGWGAAGLRCVNTGFRGSGYIGDWNGNQTITFTMWAPSTGQYDISFRYQNATEASTRQLTAPNGTTTMVFPNTHGGDTTGNWANGSWSTSTVSVLLYAGNNSISLTGGNGFVDLDEIAAITPSPTGPPTAPSGLTGTVLSWAGNGPALAASDIQPLATVRLEWEDNSFNETGYRVYQQYGGLRLIAQFAANTTSGIVQQSGVDRMGGGQDLLYVVAYNTHGESTRSEYYDVFAPTPASPELLSHTRVDNSYCGSTATDCRRLQFAHTSTLGWTTYDFVANFVLFASGVTFSNPPGVCFGDTCSYTIYLNAAGAPLGGNPSCINITGMNSGRRNLGPPSNTICLPSSTSQTFQAEYASLSGSPPPIVSTENPGYTGAGYVGVFGEIGQRITFNVYNTGSTTQVFVSVRERSIETGVYRTVYVNGSHAGIMQLPKTADNWWEDSWTNAVLSNRVTLNPGNNTIVIEYTGSGGSRYADIDSITLQQFN